ncbi:DUF898 family protein [Geotalea sp. SG265]|uniref:DUF898 family protein n=1 Tax=Geotalea sp. SG265 TaxID=2922867 RepID=UPI001FAFD5B3|nr:DUF898 family protein [Geotalea sp. SG265]
MPRISITCPHCRFRREMEDTAIPAGVTRATCPKCRQPFPLQDAIEHAAAVPQPPAEPPSLPTMPTPVQAAGTVQTSPSRPRMLRFSFTGTAREYFGIWIVNTLLKIITLGIYSAWAKVRKRRYFYGNTLLNNTAFEYMADPLALFKGWLLAAVFFILYSIGTNVNPILAATLGLIFFFTMPWLIVRSRIFNMRNSAHRNIRFTFQPSYREAYLVFAGLPFLVPVTLGIIAPYMVYRQKKFFIENSGYGRNRCSFDATVKDFYLLFIKAAGLALLVVAVLAVCGFVFSTVFRDLIPLFVDGSSAGKKTMQKGFIAIFFAVIIGMNFIYLFFTIYVQTALANLTWQGTRIRNSRFSSTLRVRDMAWLYISSAVAILCSLGLLIPWASIRITRYRFENLSLLMKDDPESFLGWGHAGVGAAGEEIGDMFGIDVGL